VKEDGQQQQQPAQAAPQADQPAQLDPRQMATMQAAHDRKSEAGAEEPQLDLETEAQKDPVAAQKIVDVKSEKAPRAVEKVPEFMAGSTKRLNTTHREQPLEAMRKEVTENGTKYLGLGALMPMEEIVGHQGISRLLDLPGLYRYKYLTTEMLGAHPDEKSFVKAAKRGNFNPDKDLDDTKTLSGKAQETWWFPTDGGELGADLKKLREALYIQDDPSYAGGVVRLDIPPGEYDKLGIEVFKPTAFDGVMQGWGNDPWWQPGDHPNWGLTKNNTKEAVMLAQKIGTFKHRQLILDGAAPAPEAHDTDASQPAAAAGGGK
jgi:hypothetical protein